MKKVLVCVGAVIMTLGSAAPAQAQDMSFGSTATVFPRDRSTAVVSVTVSCHPGMTDTPSEGTTTVTITQEQRGATVTGTGSVSVICDGSAREYLIPVTASSGVFVRGPAVVSGQTSWDMTMCISHPEFGTECDTGRMTMRPDPQQITIVYSSHQ